MSPERRRWPRAEIFGELHGRTFPLDEPITLHDVSLGGMSIEMRHPLEVGSRHDFQLSDGGNTAILSGRISHVRGTFVADEAVYACGVQFVDLTDAGRTFLRKFLSEPHAPADSQPHV